MQPRHLPSPWFERAAAWLAAACAATALTLWPLLDERVADALLPLLAREAPSELVIIDIDEASLAAVGPWPWPRAQLAQLVEQLRVLGARHQYWDFFFVDPRPDDAAFANVLGADVTLGVVPVLDARVDPAPRAGVVPESARTPCAHEPSALGALLLAPTLAGTSVHVGHLAPQFDADGRLRRLPARVCVENRALATLALAPPLREVPMSDQLRVPFFYPPSHLTALPAALVLSGQLPPGYLEGRVVLVGATALGASDRVATPFGPVTAGVTVHAQLLAHQLSAAPWPKEAPSWLVIAITLASVAFALLAPRAQRWLLALVPAAPLSHLIVLPAGMWLPPAMPAVAALAALGALVGTRHLTLLAERAALTRQLAALLPRELAVELAAALVADGPRVAAQPYAVALVALRNIDLVEKRFGAAAAVQARHLLLAALRPVAQRHGGDFYPSPSADAYLIAWPQAKDAQAYLRAAAALAAAAQQALAAWPEQSEEAPLAVVVGLAQGSAYRGFIGTGERRVPVLSGPAVRRAEALTHLANEYAVVVLAAADSRDLPVGWQALGEHLVPGETEPLTLVALPAP